MNTNLTKNEKKYLEQISRVIFYDWEHSEYADYSDDYPSNSSPVDYETLFYNRNMQDVDLHDSKRISTMKSLINKGIIKFTSINEANDSIQIIKQ
mgnify:CR=1 FL=1|tara:strand:+ start:86 stop:370 length:285 start_codon:yes stop_codon:yes gene_type:complete